MSDRLKQLIEQARHYQMSPQDLVEQEISFAYGNAHFENELVTRKMVARAVLPPVKGPRDPDASTD